MWIIFEIIGDILALSPYFTAYHSFFAFLLLDLLVACVSFRAFYRIYFPWLVSRLLPWIGCRVFSVARLLRAITTAFDEAIWFIISWNVEYFWWILPPLCCVRTHSIELNANWLLTSNI